MRESEQGEMSAPSANLMMTNSPSSTHISITACQARPAAFEALFKIISTVSAPLTDECCFGDAFIHN